MPIGEVQRLGFNQQMVWEGFQVPRHPLRGYRSEMSYSITTRTTIAKVGRVRANEYINGVYAGPGRGTQIFFPDPSVLETVWRRPLFP